MARRHIPDDVETAVLIKCARRCALCHHLFGDFSLKQGQIAHLDGDSSNSAEENLIFLCLNHHSDYDSRTSQHKNYQQSELRHARAQLHFAIERGEHHAGTRQQLEASDNEATQNFFKQARSLEDTPITKKIQSAPYWRTLIRPTSFLEANFQSDRHCADFVRSMAVQSRPHAAYPLVDEITMFRDGNIIWGAKGEVDLRDAYRENLDAWAMFNSGQFLDNRAVRNFPELGRNIHYLEVLRVVFQVVEFASRMAQKELLIPEAYIDIQLRNAAGLGLFTAADGAPHLKRASIEVSRHCDPAELIDGVADLSLGISVEIYSKFGWPNPPNESLRIELARFRMTA